MHRSLARYSCNVLLVLLRAYTSTDAGSHRHTLWLTRLCFVNSTLWIHHTLRCIPSPQGRSLVDLNVKDAHDKHTQQFQLLVSFQAAAARNSLQVRSRSREHQRRCSFDQKSEVSVNAVCATSRDVLGPLAEWYFLPGVDWSAWFPIRLLSLHCLDIVLCTVGYDHL
jgi:hypothetical protein